MVNICYFFFEERLRDVCHICVIHTEASGPQILDGNAYFFGVHFFQQEMEGSSLDTSHYSLSREGHLGNPLALTLSYYMNIGVEAAYVGLVSERVMKRSVIIFSAQKKPD